MSVKSRILQFQSTSPAQAQPNGGSGSGSANISANNFINGNSHSNSRPAINGSSPSNTAVIKHATIATVVTNRKNSDSISNSNINNSSHQHHQYQSPSSILQLPTIKSNNSSHFSPATTLPPLNRGTTTTTNKICNTNNIPRLQNHNHNQNQVQPQPHRVDYQQQHIANGSGGQHHQPSQILRKSSDPSVNGNKLNTFYGLGVEVCLNSKSANSMSGISNPPVNRANKPILAQKKASMTINLSANSTSTNSTSPTNGSESGNGIGDAVKFGKSLNKTLSTTNSSPTSAIPKPFGGSMSTSTPASNGLHSKNVNGTSTSTSPSLSSNGVVMRRSTSTGRVASPATTPTGPRNFGTSPSSAFGSTISSSSGRLYGTMGWKEKYEESEKKRSHLTNLAQKATRDYEELRRRFHDVYAENEKLSRRLDSNTTQLDSLRKASEAVYEDYYKLKKRYEAENREKSDALTRVDQYNKENRRLKRQSAAMMMQISDPTSLASAFDAVCETDSAENDKEILYLRNRVQELENKVVDLDSELEKAKLAEFETQESVMLINDSVNCVKSENYKLKEQLKQLDEEARKSRSALEDATFELESLRGRYSIQDEKLILAETELKKILNEKSILQRQSLVFMNDAMDNRLMDALNQIGDMQNTVEDQRNRFETQLAELQGQLAERESQMESMEIETVAKLRSLEEQVQTLRKRAEDAEQRLEEGSPRSHQSSPERGMLGTPPPPPPPMPHGFSPPPPPPPPMMPMGSSSSMNGSAAASASSLNNSLKSAMGTLRKTNAGGGSNSSNGSNGGETPPNGLAGAVGSSPQIDDVISQLKKGIKLKPMDRTLSRKPTEAPQEKQEDTAVEEMRSILNNLRRTKRLN